MPHVGLNTHTNSPNSIQYLIDSPKKILLVWAIIILNPKELRLLVEGCAMRGYCFKLLYENVKQYVEHMLKVKTLSNRLIRIAVNFQ